MVNGLLLVGHGSRSPRHETEMQALTALVAAALPETLVDVGFLEMSVPPAGPVLDGMVAAGCDRIVVLPFMLLGAGHAKSDVPALVLEGRARHRSTRIDLGGPLGISHALVAMLGDALLDRQAEGLPLLVIARGTSDPDANGDACKAARLLGEWTKAPFVHTGFSGVTRPPVPEALDVFARLDHPRMAVAFWFLCFGVLIDRARRDIAEFAARTGTQVVDAGYLGADPRLVPVIVEQYHRTLDPTATSPFNCDLCAYRAPWPGLDDRIGQPIGVGHSHLALEHRHSHRS